MNKSKRALFLLLAGGRGGPEEPKARGERGAGPGGERELYSMIRNSGSALRSRLVNPLLTHQPLHQNYLPQIQELVIVYVQFLSVGAGMV